MRPRTGTLGAILPQCLPDHFQARRYLRIDPAGQLRFWFRMALMSMGPWVSGKGRCRWRVRKARRPQPRYRCGGRKVRRAIVRRHVGQGPGDLLRTGQARGHREIAFGMRELGQPKSRILRRPSVVRRRLAGFRSRWMMRAWAAARPCASCKPRRTTPSRQRPQPASYRAILPMYSVTRKSVWSSVSKSWMVAILGWLSWPGRAPPGENACGQPRPPGCRAAELLWQHRVPVARRGQERPLPSARADLLHDAVVAEIFPSMSPNTPGC